MHSVLAIDKSGIPLGNAMTWADNRAKKEAQKLKTLLLAKLFIQLPEPHCIHVAIV